VFTMAGIRKRSDRRRRRRSPWPPHGDRRRGTARAGGPSCRWSITSNAVVHRAPPLRGVTMPPFFTRHQTVNGENSRSLRTTAPPGWPSPTSRTTSRAAGCWAAWWRRCSPRPSRSRMSSPSSASPVPSAPSGAGPSPWACSTNSRSSGSRAKPISEGKDTERRWQHG
jgi:hypothetical protein